MNGHRIKKEIRTLFPTWNAVVGLVIGLQILARHYSLAGAGAALAFIIGSAILGALSFGSEYDSRTMHYLLSQPSPRGLLWVEKMFVTCLAFLGLYLITLVSIPVISYGPFEPGDFLNSYKGCLEIGIVPLCALAATPFLTLISRSTFTGALLSIILPILLLLDANWMVGKLHIHIKDDSLFWLNMGLVAAYSLAMLGLAYLKFTRLQVVESRNRFFRWSFRLPWTVERRGPQILQGPIMRLVRKEFHLQTLSFIISAACVTAWFIYHSLKHAPVLTTEAVFELYTTLIVLVAGGFSIASERNMGTTALQLTLPVSPFKQWLVKLSVVMMTGVTLGVLLPIFILRQDAGKFPASPVDDFEFFGIYSLILLSVGMFASSFSKTPLRSIIIAVVLLVCCFLLLAISSGQAPVNAGLQSPTITHVSSEALVHARRMVALIPKIQTWLGRAAAFAFMLSGAIFAFQNFRNAILRKWRTYLQICILFCVVALYSLVSKHLGADLESAIKVINQSQIP